MRDDETQTERNARRVDELRAAGCHSTLGIGLGPSESTAAGDSQQPGGDTSPPGTDPASRTTTTGGTSMTDAPLINAVQVATINAARSALDAIAESAHLENDSQASGMIFAMASAAEGDLFQLLNWYSAYAHANLTEAQIHNK